MMQKWSLILFVFFIFSCNNDAEKDKPIPEGIIKEETMVSILTDMHILEAAGALRLIADSSKFVSTIPYHQEIFKKYGTDKQKFMRSLNYYTENYEKFEIIYDDVITELSQKQVATTK